MLEIFTPVSHWTLLQLYPTEYCYNCITLEFVTTKIFSIPPFYCSAIRKGVSNVVWKLNPNIWWSKLFMSLRKLLPTTVYQSFFISCIDVTAPVCFCEEEPYYTMLLLHVIVIVMFWGGTTQLFTFPTRAPPSRGSTFS